MRILHVVGARPTFMKTAAVVRALTRADGIEQSIVHTGQHYHDALSDQLVTDLELPRPDLNLGVGSGSHGLQTGRMLIALERVIERSRPDWVLTVGAVNSTLAAALAAAKLGVRVAHVESGLRSGDRSRPEEINRRLTDALADVHFTTETAANENLAAEGVAPERIRFVGNVMIDTLERYRSRAAALAVHDAMGLPAGGYLLATLHRPENVDDPDRLRALLRVLRETAQACALPLVLPLHPRTARNVRGFGLDGVLRSLIVLAPLRYLEFLCLLDHAGAVMT
ncbi:MAG: non-hydrolyzing UDP-N-acetylglucosamine 2-epimerase, partial [Gemmatimonadota bacterium]